MPTPGITCVRVLPIFLFVVLTLVLLPSGSQGGPCQTFGLGGQAIAMGGAVAAFSADYTATFYNPAGLAFAEGPTLGAGFVYGSPDLHINGSEQDVDPIRAFQVGGSLPLGSSKYLGRITLAVAAHIPTSTAVTVGAQDPVKPHFVLYSIDPQRTAIYLGGSVRIFPSLSIGGGVSVLAEAELNLNLSLLSSSFITHHSPTKYNFDPIFGVKFMPIKSLALAAVYRESKTGTLKPELKIFVGEEQILPTITIFNLFNYEPREVVLAAMYSFRERFVFELDFTWMDYSNYQVSTPRYEFEDEVPEWVRTLMSMNNFPDPDFSDIFVPRLGSEFTVNKYFTLRGGYYYQASPVPDQRGITNYADADKHVISIGGGVNAFLPPQILESPIHIDFVFQVQILEERSVVKDNPEDPVGDYTIDGEILLGGIFLKYLF
jgi:long-chain fatty acid transport protein